MKQKAFLKTKQLFINKANLALFLGMTLFNFSAALIEGLSFSFILLAFTALSSGTAGELPSFLTGTSFAVWVQQFEAQQAFTVFVAAAILFQVFKSGLTYVGQIYATFLGTKIQIDAQEQVYRQILRMSFPCVSTYKAGDLVEYAKAPALIIPVAMDAVNRILVSCFTIAVAICVLFSLSWPLTVFAIVTFGLFGLIQKFVFFKLSALSRVFSDSMVEFSKHTVQSLHALKIIHIFDQQKNVLKKIHAMLMLLARTTKKLNLWNQAIAPFNEILGILLVGTFLIVGQWLLGRQNEMALPMLLTFITVIHRLNARIQMLLSGFAAIAGNWGQILRLEAILSDEGKEFSSTTGVPYQGLQTAIAFRQVGMKYESARRASLEVIDFEISKGSAVALVGHSGAGKSTLIDLLIGLYAPTQGVIEVDGVNRATFDTSQWKRKLGVVSQDSFMFNETIEENIRFGELEASLETVMESARIAGAHEFIERLPQGYQTIVGERGHRLSGGERQRISLARALVRNPEILILDEATSNLDSYSERCIQRALEQFRNKKTMILIAHRLSTIVGVDMIIVLDKGKVVEKGSHHELLAKNGAYAFFWNVQERKEPAGVS